MAESEKSHPKGTKPAGRQIKVRWDDVRMTTTYANVCNVASTREEVTLLFGTNRSWGTARGELVIEVSNRIILNPHAAKRLCMLLSSVIGQYETRFGELTMETGAPAALVQSPP